MNSVGFEVQNQQDSVDGIFLSHVTFASSTLDTCSEGGRACVFE